MDLASQKSSERLPVGSGDIVGQCAYCGAPLHTNVYFCIRCAMPYKDIQSVLTRIVPAPPSDELLIRHKAPSAWPLFWTYLVTVLAIGVGGFLLTGGADPGSVILIGTLIFFAVTCFFAVRYWASLSVQLRRIGFNKIAAWLGLLLLVPALALNYGYFHLLRWLAPGEDILEQFHLDQTGLLLVFCILPAVMEEVAFRGLLQHWLQVALTPFKAILLASVLFATLHLSVISFPYLLLVGVLLGWTKWKTGSLYPSMLIHFLHNFVVIFLF